MTLVAGIDSSTQSCKVVVRDAQTGALVRKGRAAHPDGTEVHPQHWWDAAQTAIAKAGGLADVAAISVGGQQHGMVCLDVDGEVVRPALLWNDTRSAGAAEALIDELGGPKMWADAVGSVPVASYTVTKLRWLRDHEPQHAARTAAVCLPHDWLSWKLLGSSDIFDTFTDRSDASGTGYWSPSSDAYRPELFGLALGHEAHRPIVLAPQESGGTLGDGVVLGAGPHTVIGAGAGDNAAAALGVQARVGDVVISIGTSGVACAISPTPTRDRSGTVSGFASASGDFLPLVATLNAARVLDAACDLLGVDHSRLSDLALGSAAGAGGLVLVPYFEGERTPNRPDATAALHGMRLSNLSPSHVARAAVEGLLCGLADGIDALVAQGVGVERVILIGGGARSEAVRGIAPAVFGRPVLVPDVSEFVADGAARQAAWVLLGQPEPPRWVGQHSSVYETASTPGVRERYAEVRELTATRQ